MMFFLNVIQGRLSLYMHGAFRNGKTWGEGCEKCYTYQEIEGKRIPIRKGVQCSNNFITLIECNILLE